MQPTATRRHIWRHRAITIASRLAPEMVKGDADRRSAAHAATLRHLLEKEKVTLDELFIEIFPKTQTAVRTLPIPSTVLVPISTNRR